MSLVVSRLSLVFFFNDTATTEIYTLSLHDALPIWTAAAGWAPRCRCSPAPTARSEEHTSELQSRRDLVCRLLLEKKKKIYKQILNDLQNAEHAGEYYTPRAK